MTEIACQLLAPVILTLSGFIAELLLIIQSRNRVTSCVTRELRGALILVKCNAIYWKECKMVERNCEQGHQLRV